MNFILLIFIEIENVMKIEPNVISNGKIINAAFINLSR